MFPTLPTLSRNLLSQPFKRSQTGLFHGALIQFGNNVPFSKHKTRRTWLPNIQRKGLRSELLGRELEVKITARALRTIKMYGGLDQYVLNTRHELLGPEGMRIRLMLRERQEELARQTAAAEARAARRRRSLESKSQAQSQSRTTSMKAAGKIAVEAKAKPKTPTSDKDAEKRGEKRVKAKTKTKAATAS